MDTNEIKTTIQEIIKGYLVQEDSKFEIINYKLDQINAQTTKTNGRVNKLEESNLTHQFTCPLNAKVRTLEDAQLSKKAINNMLIKAIGISVSITTLATFIINQLM